MPFFFFIFFSFWSLLESWQIVRCYTEGGHFPKSSREPLCVVFFSQFSKARKVLSPIFPNGEIKKGARAWPICVSVCNVTREEVRCIGFLKSKNLFRQQGKLFSHFGGREKEKWEKATDDDVELAIAHYSNAKDKFFNFLQSELDSTQRDRDRDTGDKKEVFTLLYFGVDVVLFAAVIADRRLYKGVSSLTRHAKLALKNNNNKEAIDLLCCYCCCCCCCCPRRKKRAMKIESD